MDNLSQSASLMRNFTSNRFNLKFWQRSSNDKSAVAIQQSADTNTGVDKTMAANKSNNNNNNNNNSSFNSTPTVLGSSGLTE